MTPGVAYADADIISPASGNIFVAEPITPYGTTDATALLVRIVFDNGNGLRQETTASAHIESGLWWVDGNEDSFPDEFWFNYTGIWYVSVIEDFVQKDIESGDVVEP